MVEYSLIKIFKCYPIILKKEKMKKV